MKNIENVKRYLIIKKNSFMIVNSFNKLLDKFSIMLILQLLILVNYFFWLLETNEIFRLIIVYLIFLSSFFLLFKLFKENKFLFFLIIFFIIITLGSPSFHWDARAIWLFHAKKASQKNSLLTLRTF